MLEQFGPVGEEISYDAAELASLLSGERDIRGQAGEAMERWLNFETGLYLIEVFPDTMAPERVALHRAAMDFHTALPFTEAERDWIERLHSDGTLPGFAPTDHDGLVKALATQEGEITSAGRRHRVIGADLAGRWQDWFSGNEPYQEARAQAHGALQALHELLK